MWYCKELDTLMVTEQNFSIEQIEHYFSKDRAKCQREREFGLIGARAWIMLITNQVLNESRIT